MSDLNDMCSICGRRHGWFTACTAKPLSASGSSLEPSKSAPWTPGPWSVTVHYDADQPDCRWYGIGAGEPTTHANEGHFHPLAATYATYPETVVEVSSDRDYGCPEGGIMDEANARLIAAAPDLYAALARARMRMAKYGESHAELDEIDSALAKARGESHHQLILGRRPE